MTGGAAGAAGGGGRPATVPPASAAARPRAAGRALPSKAQRCSQTLCRPAPAHGAVLGTTPGHWTPQAQLRVRERPHASIAGVSCARARSRGEQPREGWGLCRSDCKSNSHAADARAGRWVDDGGGGHRACFGAFGEAGGMLPRLFRVNSPEFEPAPEPGDPDNESNQSGAEDEEVSQQAPGGDARDVEQRRTPRVTAAAMLPRLFRVDSPEFTPRPEPGDPDYETADGAGGSYVTQQPPVMSSGSMSSSPEPPQPLATAVPPYPPRLLRPLRAPQHLCKSKRRLMPSSTITHSAARHSLLMGSRRVTPRWKLIRCRASR